MNVSVIFDLVALFTIYPIFHYLGGQLDKVRSIGRKTASLLSFLLIFLGCFGVLSVAWGVPNKGLSVMLGATFGYFIVYFAVGWMGYKVISMVKGVVGGEEE